MSREELRSLPVVVDLETAARALGIGRTAAYRPAADGRLPVRVLRVGAKGAYRIASADLMALLDPAPRHRGDEQE